MKRFLPAAAFVILAGVAPVFAQTATPAAEPAKSEALPSGEALLARFVEVTGGAKAYESIKTQMATGKFSMPAAGLTGAIKAYSKWPNLSYASVEIQGIGTIEEGTTAEMAWENSALQGARIKSGDEAAALMREAALDVHTNWKKYYDRAETAGVEAVGDKTCYKVLLTPHQGAPETVYFDKETGYMVKQSAVYDTPMGKIPAVVTVSDYRKQGDLTLAFTVQQEVAGQQFEIKMDTITFNPDIPDSRFEPPAEVKALKNSK